MKQTEMTNRVSTFCLSTSLRPLTGQKHVPTNTSLRPFLHHLQSLLLAGGTSSPRRPHRPCHATRCPSHPVTRCPLSYRALLQPQTSLFSPKTIILACTGWAQPPNRGDVPPRERYLQDSRRTTCLGLIEVMNFVKNLDFNC